MPKTKTGETAVLDQLSSKAQNEPIISFAPSKARCTLPKRGRFIRDGAALFPEIAPVNLLQSPKELPACQRRPSGVAQKTPRCGIRWACQGGQCSNLDGFDQHTRFETNRSATAGELHLDRKTVRKHLLDTPQTYKRGEPGTLQDRSLPSISAGTKGNGRAQCPQTARWGSQAWGITVATRS